MLRTLKLTLLENTPVQAESLLHSPEQAAIDLNMKSDETEFTCFNQADAIVLLNGKHLKLVDRFIYLGSNISSPEIYA